MKLVIDNSNETVSVYGDYNIDDIRREMMNAGLDPEEWVIEIFPLRFSQTSTYPLWFNNYEIKA